MDKMESKRSRILALDILRGYFIVVIIVNHLSWHTNLLEPFTGKGQLWATAAEGFFTVSGMLVGYIYGPKILRATIPTVTRIWKRAALLYILFLASTWAFSLLALSIGSPHVPPGLWHGGSIIDMIGATISFNYLYGLNDFLSRYALFMAVAPFIVWLLAKYTHRGAVAIVISSITLWLALQPHVYSSTLADILIWQVVFMPSIVIGFYLPSIERWFLQLKSLPKRVLLTTLFSVTALTYLTSYIYASYNSIGLAYWLFDKLRPITDPIITGVRFIGDNAAHLTDKQSLGVLALVTGVFWFWTLYIITRKYEEKINTVSKGLFAFTGRNSLAAYVIHAFVIFFFTLTFQSPSDGEVLLKTLVTLIIVAISLGLTWLFVYARNYLLKKR